MSASAKPMSREESKNLGISVAHLRDTQNMKWDEIGKKLGIPMETARNAYRRHKSREAAAPAFQETGSGKKQKQDGETFEDNSEDINNRTVSSVGERITTLEQLLEFAKVDLKIWEVDHFIINKWEGFRAAKSKDIVMDDGVMTGWTKDTGDILISPLFQVKVWLIRKHPEALTPFVSTVKVSGHVHLKHEHKRGNIGLALLFFDPHIAFRRDFNTGKLEPLHDRRAMNIVSQVAAALPFDTVVLGGDGFDFAQLSDKFIQSPEFDYTLQPALNEMSWWLSELSSACPNAKKYYIGGNHDLRFYNYMIGRVPQVYNVKTRKLNYSFWELRNLMSLDEIGWEWRGPYPDGEVWITDTLRVTHGVGTSAESILKSADVSTIFGHIHRVEQASRTVWSRGRYRTIHAFCPGFLGRMDGVIPGVKGKQNWSQGFAIIEYDKDGETINHVPIYNGSAIYDRSRWVGEDYGDKSK